MKSKQIAEMLDRGPWSRARASETIRAMTSRRIDDRRASEGRLLRAIDARRRLTLLGSGGRAWINGREVGGTDPRWVHLTRSHD